MAELPGMDVQEVRALAAFAKKSADELASVRDRLTTSVRVSTWKGRDADQFLHRWNGQLRPQLVEVERALLAAQEVLLRNADDQQRTSDTLDGSGGFPITPVTAMPGGVPIGPIPPIPMGPVVDFLGDVADWTGDRIHDAVEWTGDRIDDVVQWTGDRIDDVATWTGDRIQDGVELAVGVWDDVTARAAAGWAGFQRFSDDLHDFATLPWRTLTENGRMPYPMEVLASVTVVAATGFGTLWNVVEKKDMHFFDDGAPEVGPARIVSEGVTVPTDFVSLTQHTMDAYGDESTDGIVRVTVIRNPGQEPRYVVSVPGTEGPEIQTLEAWGGSDAANDWHANVRRMAAGTNSYDEGVKEAIRRAIEADRLAHPDEEHGTPIVLLTGHSQGGYAAAYLAADEQFASQYDIRGVVNYAGPIDNAGVPSSIPVLSLVNGDFGRGDLIPTLDGGRLHVLNSRIGPEIAPGVGVQITAPFTPQPSMPVGPQVPVLPFLPPPLQPFVPQVGVRVGPTLGEFHDAVSPTHIEQVRMPALGPTWDVAANHGQPGYLRNVEEMFAPGASGDVADNAARVQAWEHEHGLSQFYRQEAGGIDGDTGQVRQPGEVTQIEGQVGRTVE